MSHSRSFTLIELVVTLGIIALMLGAVIPNIGPFRQKQTLERSAIELRNHILEAQAYTLAPRRVDRNIVGYRFGFATAGGNANTFATAKLGNPVGGLTTVAACPDPNSILIDCFRLPAGITFGTPTTWKANPAGIYEIDFLIADRAKAQASNGAAYVQTGTVDIPLIRGADTKTVNVSLDTGSVTIE
ncbi:prepilin-type N-terminal cleavage/methylation domain-containing protein [Candidatus Berkelbacteria bacterium]|nr:prepilin-type N-terminal cleavage/methylation domain-containing protein [Candidatus Berkelbacteria bacterium]